MELTKKCALWKMPCLNKAKCCNFCVKNKECENPLKCNNDNKKCGKWEVDIKNE